MKEVSSRLIDGVDPEIVDEVKVVAGSIADVKEVTDVLTIYQELPSMSIRWGSLERSITVLNYRETGRRSIP